MEVLVILHAEAHAVPAHERFGQSQAFHRALFDILERLARRKILVAPSADPRAENRHPGRFAEPQLMLKARDIVRVLRQTDAAFEFHAVGLARGAHVSGGFVLPVMHGDLQTAHTEPAHVVEHVHRRGEGRMRDAAVLSMPALPVGVDHHAQTFPF